MLRSSGSLPMACAALLSLVLCACATGVPATRRNRTQPAPVLHTWLLPDCPSERGRAAVGAFATGLAVSAVDSVIDWLSDALVQAAKEDREGRATRALSAAYLWWSAPARAERGLMSCAVVTVSRSSPARWCEDGSGPFAIDAPAVCRYFAEPQPAVARAASLAPANWSGNSLPALYAEIRLEPATDGRGVLPRLVALYYPQGIHGGRFAGDVPRTLQLSVAATTPEGAAALGSLVLHVDGAVPARGVQTGTLMPTAGANVWAAVLSIPPRYAAPEFGGPIIPVNVTAEVRETGNPDPFLQALSTAFARHRTTIAEGAALNID